MQNIELKIAEDVAITEMADFAETFTFNNNPSDIKDKYPHALRAMCTGLLTLENNVPKLRLTEPIKTESGSNAVEELTFKTRFTFSDKKRLASGLNLQKDSFEYLGRVMAFIIGQPVAMLDKFGPFDMKVIEQLSSLFM